MMRKRVGGTGGMLSCLGGGRGGGLQCLWGVAGVRRRETVSVSTFVSTSGF